MESNILNHNSIEKNTLYSYLLSKEENPNLQSVLTISKKVISSYVDISLDNDLPDEYYLLEEVVNELEERISCYKSITQSISSKIKSTELSIIDYGSGQGLSSLCFLYWLKQKHEDTFLHIKNIKLIDKSTESLQRALLHYSILFPELNVIAYEQDLHDNGFAIECDSTLTINIFSHFLYNNYDLIDKLPHIINSSHSLLVHNIFLEKTESPDNKHTIKPHFYQYVNWILEDETDLEQTASYILTTSSSKNQNKYWYAIHSRTNLIETKIVSKKDNDFSLLCPGVYSKDLININQRMLWFNRPLLGTKYCDTLDNFNKISLFADYISPDFTKEEANEYIPEIKAKTIKYCAEHFMQAHICHALSCNLPCGYEILSLYREAAENGIYEAYNNIGVLYMYNALDDESRIQEGVSYFILAAEKGSASAMMNLASYYAKNGDHEIAIRCYQEAAKLKDTTALYNLAIIFHFGLFNQQVDLVAAKQYYYDCLTSLIEDEDQSWKNDASYIRIQNNCCKNLILLLFKEDSHYLTMLDVFQMAVKPFPSLLYCREVLRIIYTARFHKDILKTLHINDISEEEEPFITYNRAVFNYNGLNLEKFGVKVSENKELAINTIKSLISDKDKQWDDKHFYLYRAYANWILDKDKNEAEKYWRILAESSSRRCAPLTNIALFSEKISNEERKQIWNEFAHSNGCKSCDECVNYNIQKRICPKAQYHWAKDYETDENQRNKMMKDSAEQQYRPALYYLGYTTAIQKELPSLEGKDSLLSMMLLSLQNQSEYDLLCQTLAKDCYWKPLQKAAELGSTIPKFFMFDVSKLRNSKYNQTFWGAITLGKSNNNQITFDLLNFFISKTGKNIDEEYFNTTTIEEAQLLLLAQKYAKESEDIQFICSLANFYLSGNKYNSAKEFYDLAKKKGCNDIDDKIQFIENKIHEIEIEAARQRRLNEYEEPDYMRDTWDAMTDGMYGDMPDGFDGDFDFLGF